MLGEKFNSNVNGVLNRAHGLVPKGAGVLGIAVSYTNSKFGYADSASRNFALLRFRFAPIQVTSFNIQIPILNKSRLVENKAITTNLDILPTSVFGLRSPVFDLRTSDFGLPTSVFGLRTSDFGLRTSDSRLRTSDFGLLTPDFGLPTSFSSYFYRSTTFTINSNIFYPQFYNLNFQNLKSFSVSKVEQNWTSAFSSINFIYLHTGTSPPRCRARPKKPPKSAKGDFKGCFKGRYVLWLLNTPPSLPLRGGA